MEAAACPGGTARNGQRDSPHLRSGRIRSRLAGRFGTCSRRGNVLLFGPFETDEEAVEFAHSKLNDSVTETEEYATAAEAAGAPSVADDALFVRDYTIRPAYHDIEDARRDLYERASGSE